MYLVTPDITSPAISYFDGGATFPAGNYAVSYVTGAVDLNQSGVAWVATQHFHVTDGAGNDAVFPSTTFYPSPSVAMATEAGQQLMFAHLGGKIGVFLQDSPYGDNVAGSPSPTFGIPSPPAAIQVPTLTATPSLPGNVPSIILQGS